MLWLVTTNMHNFNDFSLFLHKMLWLVLYIYHPLWKSCGGYPDGNAHGESGQGEGQEGKEESWCGSSFCVHPHQKPVVVGYPRRLSVSRHRYLLQKPGISKETKKRKYKEVEKKCLEKRNSSAEETPMKKKTTEQRYLKYLQ